MYLMGELTSIEDSLVKDNFIRSFDITDSVPTFFSKFHFSKNWF